MKPGLGLVLVLGACSVLSGCVTAPQARVNGRDRYGLTPEEAAVARRVAEEEVIRTLEGSDQPTLLVSTELILDKPDLESAPDEGKRIAKVTHYRYDGDVAVLSYVDLESGKLLKTEKVPHLPVRLTEGEFERAKRMALGDDRLKEALGDSLGGLVVEPLVARTSSEEDPMFGHRVVRLLFKQGRDYLRTPVVHVDLTAGKVLVEEGKGRSHEEGNR